MFQVVVGAAPYFFFANREDAAEYPGFDQAIAKQ
jgi:hypothetical protein